MHILLLENFIDSAHGVAVRPVQMSSSGRDRGDKPGPYWRSRGPRGARAGGGGAGGDVVVFGGGSDGGGKGGGKAQHLRHPEGIKGGFRAFDWGKNFGRRLFFALLKDWIISGEIFARGEGVAPAILAGRA